MTYRMRSDRSAPELYPRFDSGSKVEIGFINALTLVIQYAFKHHPRRAHNEGRKARRPGAPNRAHEMATQDELLQAVDECCGFRGVE